MLVISPFSDTSGAMSQEEVNARNISNIIEVLNRGIDSRQIPRRSIPASGLKIFFYQPSPIKLHTGATLAAGAWFTVVANLQNSGQTNSLVGQTFLPVLYVDLFVDPPDTGSTANMYANSGGYVYPDGGNISAGMSNLTFTPYLRNSTPGVTGQDVVSYVFQIRNQDSAAHAYWMVPKILLPADDNLNSGTGGNFLP